MLNSGRARNPTDCFRRTLVNALIHRDYFVSAPVRLFIFDNRVEIINPGNLPDHLTVEKIRAGNSIQRNPILASFAAKGLLPYRGLGTGVRRALQDWPRIQFIDDHDGCLFTTLIERHKIKSKEIKGHFEPLNEPINGPLKGELTDLQIHLLEILREDPLMDYENLASKLGKARSTIKRTIQQLKSLGILRRLGFKKTGYWELL